MNGRFEGVPPVPVAARLAAFSGCLLPALVLTCVGALFVGAFYLADYIDLRLHLWADPDSGSPLLIDTWVGRFTTAGDHQLAMLIDIEFIPLNPERPRRFGQRGRRPKLFRDSGAHTMTARVFVCDGPGWIRRMRASGRAYDNRASRFFLWADRVDKAQPQGLAPGQMLGRWDGGNAIEIEASLHLSHNRGALTSSDDPDLGSQRTPLTLRRGTEAAFYSLCAQLDPSRARRSK